jgi:hypothetical protein
MAVLKGQNGVILVFFGGQIETQLSKHVGSYLFVKIGRNISYGISKMF